MVPRTLTRPLVPKNSTDSGQIRYVQPPFSSLRTKVAVNSLFMRWPPCVLRAQSAVTRFYGKPAARAEPHRGRLLRSAPEVRRRACGPALRAALRGAGPAAGPPGG